jgi:hypothetical protein
MDPGRVPRVAAVNVRVGFSRPRAFNPLSWLIMRAQRSEVSHTFLVYFDEEWGADFVLEAHELGFRLLPFARFQRENVVVGLFRTKVDLEPGLKWAANWLGTTYDFGGLLGMAWVMLGRMLRKRFRNPLQNSHSMFCSEMNVRVLQFCAEPGSERIASSGTSPLDLLRFGLAAHWQDAA